MTIPRDIELYQGIIFALLTVTLVGCQTEPSRVDENFGSSVRHVVAVQTAQPRQRAPGMDGEKANAVLRTYRKDVAKPEKVERDLIRIDLGK